MSPHQSQPSDDPFNTLLNLEDDYYNQGYAEGAADGALAGRTEGRQLGLEKGYQKFFESGRLYGRAILWANRFANATSSSPSQSSSTSAPAAQNSASEAGKEAQKQLPPLPINPRLEKHITILYALVETESLSTENTDEAVNDFDDRFKRAQGKAKIIERMLGEKASEEAATAGDGGDKGLTV
ncbi:hypothetical protein QBC38DRAFT_477328 [Podospora fimiseda]|uniref:Essential protein Yae1 N-terminal domain-containing protein n=1 Tax=Podospora fimiseda TaxID=252190 RepID=A0AAN7BQD3_9PEZI|nr:hypothetical protein QBC38DRAFT_477328 [Podospora fimiseda]